MCEANAYMLKDGEETLLMESVDLVEPEADGTIRLVGIFGDQITIMVIEIRGDKVPDQGRSIMCWKKL